MWQLKILKRAEKVLEKLDKPKQAKLANYLDNIRQLPEPHKKAKALTGKLTGLWRFRVNDFRIICQIDRKTITILVLDIGDRKEIYKH
jgi:mRNA interferase RelE/StbE